MIITRKVLVSLATGFAVVVIGIPAASASTAAPVTQVIKVKTVNTGNTMPSPTSFGFTENLWQGGKKVGNDAIQCSFASQQARTGECAGVLWFGRTGSFFISFTVGNSNTVHGQIVGGTGAYATARGTVT